MIRRRFHLTPDNKARSPYFYVPFTVPEGTTRVDVTLAYAKSDDSIVDLGCADPRLEPFPARDGFRGWSGGARTDFFVATNQATPGYLAGPLPEGTWNVILGLYRVPAAGIDAEITVTLDDAPRPIAQPLDWSTAARPGEGWYRGDLHCHCFHSDAAGAPEVLHAAARQAGLDFLAVSDHNTISQNRYFQAASSPELVFVPAMEVTTEHGHANVFGCRQWVDFRIAEPDDVHWVADHVHGQGGLLSINHDKPGIPWKLDWPAADCMEVWQHPWLAWNWVSLERWQQKLAAGMRLPAIGGSDWHQPAELHPEGPFALARPTTVLHLPELCQSAILEAIEAGHGYITEAPDGPHLELTVGDVQMGGTARGGSAKVVTRGAGGDTLALHDATGLIASRAIADDNAILTFDLAPERFVRAEIVAVASRERLLDEFRAAFADGLPWGLTEAEIARQPLRRALSNPVWLES